MTLLRDLVRQLESICIKCQICLLEKLENILNRRLLKFYPACEVLKLEQVSICLTSCHVYKLLGEWEKV